MFNINKVRELCKRQGMSISHLCSLIDRERTYFIGVERREGDLKDKDAKIIADALHTTVAYLRDETDDPSVPVTIQQQKEWNAGMSERAALLGNIVEPLRDLPEDKLDTILRVIVAFRDK